MNGDDLETGNLCTICPLQSYVTHITRVNIVLNISVGKQQWHGIFPELLRQTSHKMLSEHDGVFQRQKLISHVLCKTTVLQSQRP